MGIDSTPYNAIPWFTTRRTVWRSAAKSLWAIPETLKLARQLRRQRCQLVYSNSMAIAMGAWAAAIVGIPHVWHIHELGCLGHGCQFDLGTAVAAHVFRRFGGFFIFNSLASVANFRAEFRVRDLSQRSKVIYQSVTILDPDPLLSNPVSPGESTLVLVGALHENKGQSDALRAVKELKDQSIETSLLLVGDGEDKDCLQQMAEEFGIQNQVQFVGFAENVSNWYACAGIVLVCSRHESFGRVAVEAMLSKKPLIAARTGGLQEIVEDGVTGLFYEPGNIHMLAGKIKMLMQDRNLAAELAHNGYSWASPRFTKERYGQELYQTLAVVGANE
jgi:glycosyltransferase involved in cell wall biosynthesis